MRTCLIALSLILVIEGCLAWVSGLPQLTAMLAGMVAAGGASSFWKRNGGEWGWAMLVGLYVVAAVVSIGVRECGVILATSSLHFVAWYFCARAIRFGAPELTPGTLDGRPGIFAVAFYGTLVLATLLVRGGIFPLGQGFAVVLAFSLFVLGLVVMEKGRFLRMREGAQDRGSRKRGIVARALALSALMAVLFFVFAKPVPVAADGLVKMALDLQGKTEDSGLDADDMPDLDDVPMHRPPPRDELAPGIGRTQQQAGDSLSQTRSLPDRANLQTSHVAVVYLEMENESQAAALARRPLYVRSSTLGRYSEDEWRRVGEGKSAVWLRDQDDGREDGRVTLPLVFPAAPAAAEVRYRVYAKEATGGGLLALQGVSEFALPQVQRYDDDWYRAGLFGDVTYHAASRPLSLDDVISANELKPGDPGGRGIYLEVESTGLMERISGLLKRMPAGRLEEQLLWLRQFMAANYQYSTTVENSDLLDPLENFLFEEKRGYCDFFATAGALLTRMMGVPSRIGYGYSQAQFDGERIFTFYADGAHSWTEVFLDGHGWVVFDLTPRDGDPSSDGGGMAATRGERPDLSDFEEAEPGDSVAGGDGGGDAGDEPGAAEPAAEKSALSDLVSYVVFCSALLMFTLWYYLKRDPAREAEGADGRSAGPGRRLPAYLAEFCHLVRSFGLDPQHGETLVEMLKSLRGAGVQVDGFDAMKRYHYRTRYEDQPADPKLEKRFLQEVRSFIKEQLRATK